MRIEFKEFSGKLCQSGAAFEFAPKNPLALNLAQARQKLESNSAKTEAATPLLLVFILDGTAISLFKSGKMIVRTEDREKARQAAEKACSLL